MSNDESLREFELFESVLATEDGLAHRLCLVDTNSRYAVPVELVIDKTRSGIAIVAATPIPVAIDNCLSAEFFAAHASLLGGPHVSFDAETRVLTTSSFVLTKEIDSPDDFWNAIWDVTNRLRAVVHRIDFVNQGMQVQTAARIGEADLSEWEPELRTYRPFKTSSSMIGSVDARPQDKAAGTATEYLLAWGVLEHKGFFFHEDRGEYITYSWTGVDDRWEIVVIGETEDEARRIIDDTDGLLGGGLSACDDPIVVAGFARQSRARERGEEF